MKKLHLLMVMILICSSINLAVAAKLAEIKGKITDAKTNEPLSGATIYISDLKATTISDSKGEFSIKNIPVKGKFLVEVRYVGYKTTSQLVDLNVTQNLNFSLESSVI